jgi:hypothetical protein
MTTPENTLEFAIDCMADASNQLSNLDNELLVAVDLDYFDVHQMREALQFIAEGLLRDALQCKSFWMRGKLHLSTAALLASVHQIGVRISAQHQHHLVESTALTLATTPASPHGATTLHLTAMPRFSSILGEA